MLCMILLSFDFKLIFQDSYWKVTYLIDLDEIYKWRRSCLWNTLTLMSTFLVKSCCSDTCSKKILGEQNWFFFCRQNVTFQVGKAQHHLQASERTPLVGTSSRTYSTTVEIKDPKKKQQEGASLFKVLAKTYGPDFLKAWGCKFLYDLLQMASPSLLR